MIRGPLKSDQAFVASTWVRSMLSHRAHQQVPHATRRHGADRSMGGPIGEQLNARVNALMDHRHTSVLITAWDEEPDVILGWMVYAYFDVPTIHYVWIRQSERNKGLATAMLKRIGVNPDMEAVCTSAGPDSQLLRNRYKLSRFIPAEEWLRK